MRILFLHEVNYLKKPIFEMHEFPEYLAAKGHEVGFVQFPEGEPKESLSRIPWKQKIQGRVVKESHITLFTPKTRSASTFGRVRAALTFSKAFARILEEFKPDVVVSFSVPTSGWQALRTCKKAKIPYVFRALDVSHKIRKSTFSALILAAEKYIYANSDWVSTNNPSMAKYCIAMGAFSARVSVDLPPLKLEHFQFSSENRFKYRQKLGIDQTAHVILYMGSFFYFSGLPDLIRSFARERTGDQYFVLVGGGDQDSELKSLVTELRVSEQVLFTGFVSFAELPGYLSIADVAVNPMIPSLVSNTALPNKVIQYMAMGIVVVSSSLDGLKALFGKSQGVFFSDNQKDFMKTTNRVQSLPNIGQLGEINSTEVRDLFASSARTADFEDRLKELLGANS